MTEEIEKTPATGVSPIVQENIPIVNFNAETLIAQAISQNVPVETMEKLLAMRKELKAEWSKEQFNKAMAKFQSECPTIVKTKEVHTKTGALAYKYAPIESIVEQVREALRNNGFSYSTTMEVLPAGVRVEVKVTHIDGHTEITPMEVPLGERTLIMSASQVTAAASTFAKRYAFCNAFGILTGDEDNDASTDWKDNPPDHPITTPIIRKDTSVIQPSKPQLDLIASLCEKKGFTKEDILDAGFNKLTGGKEGTASELIQFLINAKSKIGPNGQVNFAAEEPSGTPFDDVGNDIKY